MGADCQKLCEICPFQQGKTEMVVNNEQLFSIKQNAYQQIISPQTFLVIEDRPIPQLDVDILIVFTDKLKSIGKNRYIRSLATSNIIELQERVNELVSNNREKIVDSDADHNTSLKIYDPFFGSNIRKFIISQIKLWDSVSHQTSYMKSIVQKQIKNAVRSEQVRISLAIAEIEPELGYPRQEFCKAVIRKLKECSSKLSSIVYLTDKKQQIQKILSEQISYRVQTQSSLSQVSNYF